MKTIYLLIRQAAKRLRALLVPGVHVTKTDLPMGKIMPALLIFSLALAAPWCYAQTSAEVSDPRIEMIGNTIHIYYDILNSLPSDRFNISLEVTDEAGQRIQARSLAGDIGRGVEGGPGRHITWDLGAEGIRLNAQVFFEIRAVLVVPPRQEEAREVAGPEVTGPEVTGQAKASGEKEARSRENEKRFTRGGLMLQSLAVPGLGLTRLTGKPHWLRAVAGYGCIAASINLNRQAVDTYNSVETTAGFDNKVELYNTSIQQDNLSELFAWTALGVWVADIIWTFVRTSDLAGTAAAGEMNGISIQGGMDPVTYAPTVGIRYTFRIRP
jgi:hypothetical protein